jgi:putative molybdopterin biosynthesis protein
MEENTHMGVACRVANGEVDAGIGVQSVANRLGLDFIPMFHERYDLVCLKEISQTEQWQNIISILNSDHFQHAIHSHAGYDTTLTGTYLIRGE